MNTSFNPMEFIFQKIIDDSLLPHEKLIVENGLKHLKINLPDLLILFISLNDEDNNPNISLQIDLVNLPKTKFVEYFFNGKQSQKKDNLFIILERIVVIFMQILKKEDEESFNKINEIIELNENLIKERFKGSISFNSDVKNIEKKVKGYQSFQLKVSKNKMFAVEVWRFLIDHNFVDKNTLLINFQKIYYSDNIILKEKINWIGSYYELYYFVKLLGEKIKNTDDKFHTATHCFLKGKKDISITQLTKSNGSKINFDKIKEAINLLE